MMQTMKGEHKLTNSKEFHLSSSIKHMKAQGRGKEKNTNRSANRTPSHVDNSLNLKLEKPLFGFKNSLPDLKMPRSTLNQDGVVCIDKK